MVKNSVKLWLSLVLCILHILTLATCSSTKNHTLNKSVQAISANLNTYHMQVEFEPDTKQLTCEQTLEYRNLTDADQDRIYLHIYPNAFKYEDKTPFPKEDMSSAYPSGFNPGYIDIVNIKEEDIELDYKIRGYSEEVLEIHTPRAIKPNEGLGLSIEFIVNIPNCQGRFGFGEKTFNITNWYPILCVNDNGGWSTYPYFPIGDPFFSEAANYKVNITAPEEYTIACTGDILSVEDKGGKTTWDIEAYAVRDFAFVASDSFTIDKTRVGKTTIYSYSSTPKSGKRALKYAKDAIKVFNKRFGEYPYNQFSVVEADFYIGGMEYPNLVLIDQSLYNPESDDFLELVIVHETAHQWWYGIVGNNQIDEAWLDEGLTEFSTLLYYKDRYGQKRMDEMADSILGKGKYRALSVYTQGEQIDETIAKPIYRFEDWIVYDLLVYGKGAMVFDALSKDVGEDQFNKIFKTYYEDNMFKNVTFKELLHACNEITGKDYSDFFSSWLYDD